MTPKSRSGTPHSTASRGSKIIKSSKVTESDFTPRTRQLAVASKSHVRTSSVYNSSGPFPPTNRIGRLEFAWDTIKETSRDSEDSTITQAFQRAKTDERMKKNLITFVCNFNHFFVVTNLV